MYLSNTVPIGKEVNETLKLFLENKVTIKVKRSLTLLLLQVLY